MTPTDDPAEALRRLQRAVDDGRLPAVFDAHGVTAAVIFGSVLDDARSAADLDMAIFADGQVDLLDLVEALYQLSGCERIDVLDLSTAGLVARAEALGPGRLLWEAIPGTFAEAQVVALAMLWDTRWLRDVELEILAR